MGYSIGEVAKKTGLTTHTLRYYEKEGLLPFVHKSGSGLRVFSDNDLGWLAMIECLKDTGMPLKGIKQYIDWFSAGDATLPQRLEMFQKHKAKIQEQIKQYQNHLKKIDFKIKLYKKAVELGNLNLAMQDEEIEAQRQKIYK